jgi:hypothetical protein
MEGEATRYVRQTDPARDREETEEGEKEEPLCPIAGLLL